jgi:hypothetical protein
VVGWLIWERRKEAACLLASFLPWLVGWLCDYGGVYTYTSHFSSHAHTHPAAADAKGVELGEGAGQVPEEAGGNALPCCVRVGGWVGGRVGVERGKQAKMVSKREDTQTHTHTPTPRPNTHTHTHTHTPPAP